MKLPDFPSVLFHQLHIIDGQQGYLHWHKRFYLDTFVASRFRQ